MEEPTTRVSPTTTGGEVICIWPDRSRITPAPTSTNPPLPKPAQVAPEAASRAISRRSAVPR